MFTSCALTSLILTPRRAAVAARAAAGRRVVRRRVRVRPPPVYTRARFHSTRPSLVAIGVLDTKENVGGKMTGGPRLSRPRSSWRGRGRGSGLGGQICPIGSPHLPYRVGPRGPDLPYRVPQSRANWANTPELGPPNPYQGHISQITPELGPQTPYQGQISQIHPNWDPKPYQGQMGP